MTVGLYELAAAVAVELRQAPAGPQRHSLRALFDRLVDDDIVAAERSAVDPAVLRLLAAIDYGTEDKA